MIFIYQRDKQFAMRRGITTYFNLIAVNSKKRRPFNFLDMQHTQHSDAGAVTLQCNAIIH